jgi:hypothetical protein
MASRTRWLRVRAPACYREGVGAVSAIALVIAAFGPAPASAFSARAPQIAAPPSIDSSIRRPSLGPEDGSLVRAPDVLAHADTGVGLDFEIATRPIVLHDEALDTSTAVVDRRSTLTLLYGVGLFGFAEVNLALPLVFAAGDGYSLLSAGQLGTIPEAAVGDLSLEARAMWPDAFALGPTSLRLGATSAIRFPTGDRLAFSGESTVTAAVTLLAELAYEIAFLRLEAGVRMREPERFVDVTIGSSVTLASAIGVDLFDDFLSLAATVLASIGLEDSVHPVLGAIEARLRASRYFDVVLAAGAGLTDAVGSPGFFATAGFRAYTSREER